jgi:hypothetical protein
MTLIDTGDSSSKRRSGDSVDTASKSDSSRHMKVVAAAATMGITFDFGVSNVGRTHVAELATHV